MILVHAELTTRHIWQYHVNRLWVIVVGCGFLGPGSGHSFVCCYGSFTTVGLDGPTLSRDALISKTYLLYLWTPNVQANTYTGLNTNQQKIGGRTHSRKTRWSRVFCVQTCSYEWRKTFLVFSTFCAINAIENYIYAAYGGEIRKLIGRQRSKIAKGTKRMSLACGRWLRYIYLIVDA